MAHAWEPHANSVAATGALDELAAHAARVSIVLIGEASHGTRDFYAMRADLTRRLIADHGFRAVTARGRLARYVPRAPLRDGPLRRRRRRDGAVGFPSLSRVDVAQRDDARFPRLARRFQRDARRGRAHRRVRTRSLQPARVDRIGARVLDRVDAEAAARARKRYACFEYFGDDPQGYAIGVMQGFDPCEDEAVAQLVDLRRHAMLPPASGAGDPLDVFWAEQNARLVVSAERYYRAMYRGRESTWNLRDRHMIDTLAALRERIPGTADGIVVWAHNSHLGDARATEMSDRGEVNVGQLVRERYRPDVFSIGFSTFDGTVTAASDRDAPAERKRVRPGLAESYERMFHEHAEDRFWLDLGDRDVAAALRGTLLQRAIGVIYRPETERWSHYFEARLPEQFDAIIHLDNNVAVTPLDRTAGWDEGEPPETWPTSL